MDRVELETRLREIIVSFMAVDEAKVTNSANLVDDLGLDSLDRLELLMKIEDSFSIHLPDEAAKQIVDFGSLVDCVAAALGPRVVP